MKKIGLRLLQVSGTILLLSVLTTFLGGDLLSALGFGGELVANVASIALLGIIAGSLVYLLNRASEPRGRLNPNALLWMGIALITSGMLPLGFFTYQTLFVPSMAYLALALVGFGPIFLALIGLGIYLVTRARREK